MYSYVTYYLFYENPLMASEISFAIADETKRKTHIYYNIYTFTILSNFVFFFQLCSKVCIYKYLCAYLRTILLYIRRYGGRVTKKCFFFIVHCTVLYNIYTQQKLIICDLAYNLNLLHFALYAECNILQCVFFFFICACKKCTLNIYYKIHKRGEQSLLAYYIFFCKYYKLKISINIKL